MINIKSFSRLGIAVFVVLTALSASSFAAPDKVTLRLDWTITGYHLPYYWAVKKNYYRDEGLDVEIAPGAGSQQTINLVAGGHDNFGIADYSLLAVSVARGMKVKAIYGVIQDDAWSIYSHAGKEIAKPSDLSGTSVVCVVDHKPLLDLLLKINKIDPSTVQIRTVNPATRNTVFVQGAADGLLAISIGFQTTLGKDTKRMSMGAFGVNMLGQGLIVNEDFMKANPDVVRRFVKATSRAFNDLIDKRNYEEGVRIALAASGSSDMQADLARLGWIDTVARLHSKSTRDMPIGWTNESDWIDTENVLRETGRLGEFIPPARLFSNEFISKK